MVLDFSNLSALSRLPMDTEAFLDEMDRRQRERAERSSRASSESARTD